jgi:RimJ/RimL family protein N-acetyltransferase
VTALQIPILESERIRLEPLSSSHSGGMFELWREPAVCEYSGPSFDSAGRPIELPANSELESDRLLHYWLERSLAGTGFRWAATLLENSEFVGAVGFNALGSCAEYAYHFVPRSWGAGLATESSRLALSWVFSQDSELVELFIERDNMKSIRLAEGLGFELPAPPKNGLFRYVFARAKHTASQDAAD